MDVLNAFATAVWQTLTESDALPCLQAERGSSDVYPPTPTVVRTGTGDHAVEVTDDLGGVTLSVAGGPRYHVGDLVGGFGPRFAAGMALDRALEVA